MMKLSQGLATAILTDWKTRLANCTIHLYSSTQPATANGAELGTLLARITLDGGAFVGGSPTNGLNFGDIEHDETNGQLILHRDLTETWTGEGLADGTPGWARIYDNDLVTGESAVALRIDGTTALMGGEFALSSATIKAGVPISIDTCDIKVPLYRR